MRSISTRTCDRSATVLGLAYGHGLTGLRRWIRAARDYALTSPLAIPLGVGGPAHGRSADGRQVLDLPLRPAAS